MKLEEKSDAEEKDQTCEVVWKSETIVSQERKRLDWANIGILRDSTEIREKKRGEEKGRVRKNINKNMLIFILRGVSLRMLILSNMPMILRVYNKTYFNTNDLDHCIPSFVFFYYVIIITSFLIKILLSYHLLEKLSTKLILYLKHLYLISQPIEVISRRQSNFKGKWKN